MKYLDTPLTNEDRDFTPVQVWIYVHFLSVPLNVLVDAF